jgi:uncharacterized protein YndB with AHSA1/START domain
VTDDGSAIQLCRGSSDDICVPSRTGIDGPLAWVSHQLDARPGGTFRVEVSEGNIASGVYTEIIPFRRVVFSWGWDSPDPTLAALRPGASLVEIDLEPKKGGTFLRLRHSRLPKGASKIHGDRWSIYLDRLTAKLQARPQAKVANRAKAEVFEPLTSAGGPK